MLSPIAFSSLFTMRSENLSSAGILEVNFYLSLNKKQLHFSDFVAVSAAPQECNNILTDNIAFK